MKRFPVKKCLISTLAVFVWMAAFEMLFHHSAWMTGLYHETPSLWRPMDEMQRLMPFMWIRLLTLAMVIALLYKKKKGAADGMGCGTAPVEGGRKKCPYLRGICFGLKIGVIIGVTQLGFYVYLPISTELALAWFFGSLVEGAGIGLILAVVCRKSDCTPSMEAKP